MMTESPVFLDANAILYAFDETSPHFVETVAAIQRLQHADIILCTSHHVIEEVVHVMRKAGVAATETVQTVATLPNLVLIEPDTVLAFAERYAKLSDDLHMGVNDALILQLLLDAGITKLLSFDKQFVERAAELGIKQVTR